MLLVFCRIEGHVDAVLACSNEAGTGIFEDHAVVDYECDTHDDLLCVGGEPSHRLVYILNFFAVAQQILLREAVRQFYFSLAN